MVIISLVEISYRYSSACGTSKDGHEHKWEAGFEFCREKDLLDTVVQESTGKAAKI